MYELEIDQSVIVCKANAVLREVEKNESCGWVVYSFGAGLLVG